MSLAFAQRVPDGAHAGGGGKLQAPKLFFLNDMSSVFCISLPMDTHASPTAADDDEPMTSEVPHDVMIRPAPKKRGKLAWSIASALWKELCMNKELHGGNRAELCDADRLTLARYQQKYPEYATFNTDIVVRMRGGYTYNSITGLPKYRPPATSAIRGVAPLPVPICRAATTAKHDKVRHRPTALHARVTDDDHHHQIYQTLVQLVAENKLPPPRDERTKPWSNSIWRKKLWDRHGIQVSTTGFYHILQQRKTTMEQLLMGNCK